MVRFGKKGLFSLPAPLISFPLFAMSSSLSTNRLDIFTYNFNRGQLLDLWAGLDVTTSQESARLWVERCTQSLVSFL